MSRRRIPQATRKGSAYEEDGLQLLMGDALKTLRDLPDESVQCVVTSPPYWAMRDYGVKGALGSEASLELYLRRMVRVFREVGRVLRRDGTLWLNMGDAYVGGGRGGNPGRSSTLNGGKKTQDMSRGIRRSASGALKTKDLMGQPWRLALALHADGWYLRREHIWYKPNCTPESAGDRATTAHEYVFLLTKRARYFYDGQAVREDVTGNTHSRGRGTHPKMAAAGSSIRANESFSAATNGAVESRNMRSVWTIATSPSPLPHYAMFPVELAEKCIRAGTSEHGCCAHCGVPYKRIVRPSDRYAAKLGKSFNDHSADLGRGMSQPKSEWFTRESSEYLTVGWKPGCRHEAGVVPCVVLDPFAGMATTLVAARALGRKAIGIELSETYAAKAIERLRYGVRGAMAIDKGQETLL